jgi:NitT/TauT family transport system substrate-binding protein
MRRNQVWVAVSAVLLLVAACGGSTTATTTDATTTSAPADSGTTSTTPADLTTTTAARELDKVTLNLSFLMDGGKAPMVLGKEMGFFEEEGIDVTLVEGTGSSATVQFVATKTHDFGLPGAQVLARAVNEGLPVIMVANHSPRGQEGIFVRADSPIQTLKDFEGRSVVVGLGQQTSVLIRDVFVAAGVDVDLVDIEEVTEEGKNLLFLQGQYDGTATPFESIAVMQEAEPGLELRFFPFADYGLDTLSNGLATHVDMVAENPDLVRRMVAAYAKSFLYAADHTDELIEITSRLYPSATPDILRAELEIVSALRETPNTAGQPFGWMAAEDWDATLAVLTKTEAIDSPLPHESYYTNDFIGDWEHLASSGPYAEILGGG